MNLQSYVSNATMYHTFHGLNSITVAEFTLEPYGNSGKGMKGRERERSMLCWKFTRKNELIGYLVFWLPLGKHRQK